ncbi:TonB-dependent receptor [Myroides indicus]|uniref:Iron complex outermembrane receptor protein n=1 Tax=Myroides indicus TaxID=1323422 RepID=A0A4R7F437_9FLAO|nr:TonB-dependent receptor [Myroides indicus]TDS65292.1 iron complex outermembrane receptor protein [Myroides indicus]
MKILFWVLFLMIPVSIYSQQFTVQGDISDQYGMPLIGGTVSMNEQTLMSGLKGDFNFKSISSGGYRLKISYIGYHAVDTLLTVNSDMNLHFHLKEDTTLLDQVVVSASGSKSVNHVEKVTNQELVSRFSGSFAKTLESVPGVNAMEIGAGASKPMIRGLGFNRIAVAENGAKQEGQQWGADHGLEIDAFSTEEVEVIKGVGTIEYGSDAIGGVIKINNEKVPQVHSFTGNATFFGKTVNDSYGASVQVKAREDNFFYKFKVTAQDYADYRVPTDKIYYLDTQIPIYGNRMKNTAGKNLSLYGQIGYVKNQFKNILSISNVYDKSGFFPGSHGIPDITTVVDDGNHRNVELPNQNVNHFKIINSTVIDLTDVEKLSFVLAFQNNKRQEKSRFHTHFSNQEMPASDPDLELQFSLNTFDASAKYEYLSPNNHKSTIGIQYNYQNNTIAGYGFLLPKFNRFGIGAFAMHEHYVNSKLLWEAGFRADYAKIDIKPYYDEILYEYLTDKGHSSEFAGDYAQRSRPLDKDFTSVNGMIGAKLEVTSQLNLGATLGTNFRFPTAIELASNGVHHGAFRHEKGNPDLKPEQGLAFDFRATYETKDFSTTVSPYVYYFSNYIFLKPTGSFSVLPDSGQIYEYSQSKAFISGLEWKVSKTMWDHWSVEGIFEYIYNKQLSNGKGGNYPLPFSPPMNFYGRLKYEFNDWKFFKQPEININGKCYAKQERIAQGEEITPESVSFGAGVSSTLMLGKIEAKASLTATNIFNQKILNHMSFYRPLQIPELGRSIQLMVQIPF